MDLRFPGQWFQAESGLHQNWMRDYDPALGRYLQADPLGLVDGASVYGYALQNPGRWTDPYGLEAGVVIWGGAGWGSSSFGRASAYVDDKAYTYGPGCAPSVCEYDRDEYEERNNFRHGQNYVLNFNSTEEFLFQQCLRQKAGEYDPLKNNCTDPIEECLRNLLYPVGNSTLPSGFAESMTGVDGLVRRSQNLPQSTPATGSNSPWAK